MATISVTHTLANGATIDADELNTNFTDLTDGLSDGTSDISVAAITAAGAVSLNGNVTLGNASTDDITLTGSLASTIPIKTTASYAIGSSTLGLTGVYLGANSQTVFLAPDSAMSATYTFTFPQTAGTNGFVLVGDGSGGVEWSSNNTAFSSKSASYVITDTDDVGVILATGGSASFTFATSDVNTGDDTITEATHGLPDGTPVHFLSSDQDLPAGITALKTYFVRDTDTNTFKIAETPGGTAVNITDQGSGTHTCYSGILVTLPTASANTRRRTIVKKADDATGRVVVYGEGGSETIDGAAYKSLTEQYETLELACDASDWHILTWRIGSECSVFCDGGDGTNDHGTTNTAIRHFETPNVTTTGQAIVRDSSATLGDVFHIGRDGIYGVSYTDHDGASNVALGMSVNTTQPTTAIDNGTPPTGMLMCIDQGAASNSAVTWTGKLSEGDFLRAHTNGVADATDSKCQFTVQLLRPL